METQDFRTHLENKFPDQGFTRWFDSLEINIDNASGMVQVDFPHRFFADWFAREKRQWFENELASFQQGLLVCYGQEANNGNTKEQPAQALSVDNNSIEATAQNICHENLEKFRHNLPDECVPGTSFSSFIVNRKNEFAFAVAKKMADEATSPPHTPFVLYGQVGCGKTHLIHAMVTRLCKTYPALPLYMGSVANLLEGDTTAGIEPLSKAQAFFLDNFHLIAENKALQKKFVPFFDAAQREKKLLSVSMDSHPEHTPGLDQKIKQRLKSGLVIELKKPDLDIRLKYIMRVTESLGMNVSKDEALKMAQLYQDFREIDGAVALVRTHTTLGMNKGGKMHLIVNGESDKTALNHATIISQVAEYFSVSVTDITGKSRQKNITLARQAAIYFCREFLGLSLCQIGHIFGGRDHSSIVYTLNKINEIQASNKVVNRHFTQLRKLFLT